MTAGALYITDQWPALTTTYAEKPEFSIGYTFTGNTINSGCNNVKEVACPLPAGVVGPPQAMAELYCVYEKLATMLGGKRFVAATVPNGLCPGATAFAIAKKVFKTVPTAMTERCPTRSAISMATARQTVQTAGIETIALGPRGSRFD
jgi:hypothetical protein